MTAGARGNAATYLSALQTLDSNGLLDFSLPDLARDLLVSLRTKRTLHTECDSVTALARAYPSDDVGFREGQRRRLKMPSVLFADSFLSAPRDLAARGPEAAGSARSLQRISPLSTH